MISNLLSRDVDSEPELATLAAVVHVYECLDVQIGKDASQVSSRVINDWSDRLARFESTRDVFSPKSVGLVKVA